MKPPSSKDRNEHHLRGPASSFYSQGTSRDPGISGAAPRFSDSWTAALLRCPTTPYACPIVIKMTNSHFELKQMCTLTLISTSAALHPACPCPACTPHSIPEDVVKTFQTEVPLQTSSVNSPVSHLSSMALNFDCKVDLT